MAKKCEICGKKPMVGNHVSHAHNVNKRRFNPNLQSVRALQEGRPKRIRRGWSTAGITLAAATNGTEPA